MFGIGKKSCDDANLFGYLIQAAGGAYNRAVDFQGGKLTHDQIIKLVYHMIGQKNMKISSKQENTVTFASQVVTEFCNMDNESEIKSCVKKFASMMGDFDFTDPSVNIFRASIAKFGCVFHF
jgi:hypothetical protein